MKQVFIFLILMVVSIWLAAWLYIYADRHVAQWRWRFGIAWHCLRLVFRRNTINRWALIS